MQAVLKSYLQTGWVSSSAPGWVEGGDTDAVEGQQAVRLSVFVAVLGYGRQLVLVAELGNQVPFVAVHTAGVEAVPQRDVFSACGIQFAGVVVEEVSGACAFPRNFKVALDASAV